MTDVTKKYKKKKNLFNAISFACWFGYCGFLILYGVLTGFKLEANADQSAYGKQLLDIFMPLIASFGIAFIIFVFIKEKMRTTIWMANIVISALLLGKAFVIAALVIYAVDEFILIQLAKRYKNKYKINLEIDKRE